MVISGFLFGCSVYLIYAIIKMKNTGEIIKTLVSNRINLERSKDIPGFIEYMYKKGLAVGIVASVCSLIMLIDDFVTINPWISLLSMVGFFAALIYYGVLSVKGQDKYLI